MYYIILLIFLYNYHDLVFTMGRLWMYQLKKFPWYLLQSPMLKRFVKFTSSIRGLVVQHISAIAIA